MHSLSDYIEAAENTLLQLIGWAIVAVGVLVGGPYAFVRGVYLGIKTFGPYLPALLKARRIVKRQAEVRSHG